MDDAARQRNAAVILRAGGDNPGPPRRHRLASAADSDIMETA
jgi:hypothetical protein